MKYKLTVLIVIVGMLVPGHIGTGARAAEIITEEDLIQKIVKEEQLVKTADNFIVMFDSSSSMNEPYPQDKNNKKYDVARKILKERQALLPDLGYNAGMYLFTPYKTVSPMQTYSSAESVKAIESLPPKADGPTMLQEGLRNIESIVQGLTGRTAVFLFSDGTYTEVPGWDKPEVIAKEITNKNNACLYVISSATTEKAEKLVQDMASGNMCSRVIPIEAFIERPEWITAALYQVKSTERVETITDTKIVGLKVENILFDFDKDIKRQEFRPEGDELGEFLKNKPKSYVVLTGYTDSVGSEEYNLELSRRRAESVADYLVKYHKIDPIRIVTQWFGKANPIASNATDEGRSNNRRVEVAVGLEE